MAGQEAIAQIYADAFADAVGGGAGSATVANEGAFTATGADATGATANRLLAANTSRKRFSVANNSDQDCYLHFGPLAVTTSAYSVKLPSGGTMWVDTVWTGEVRGIMGGTITSGAVRFTELT